MTQSSFNWYDAAEGLKVSVYLSAEDVARLAAGDDLLVSPVEDEEGDAPDVVEVKIFKIPT